MAEYISMEEQIRRGYKSITSDSRVAHVSSATTEELVMSDDG